MVIMRSGEATTILPGRKSLKNFDELFTPSTSFNTFRSVLLRLWKLRIRWQCKWNLFAGEKRCRGIGRTRTLREHYLENEISGIKHQWTFSEEVARSELEAIETGKRCCQSGCERIFRKLRGYDDARNWRCPESFWRTNGRKWKKSGTCDCIRKTRSFTWSKKPYVAWTQSTSSSRRKRGK